jgi:two-component SAPR family response regulator
MTMTSPSTVDLAGRRALVVEDHFLIALDMEVMLRALGVRIVDLANCVGDALAAIERKRPDFALLDLKLGPKMTAFPIAEVLLDRAIPFVFVTGYDDVAIMPTSMRKAPVIVKPVPFANLQAALTTLALSPRPAVMPSAEALR